MPHHRIGGEIHADVGEISRYFKGIFRKTRTKTDIERDLKRSSSLPSDPTAEEQTITFPKYSADHEKMQAGDPGGTGVLFAP
jgi:hypothetical protein